MMFWLSLLLSIWKLDVVELEKVSSAKEPLCKQEVHMKVLDEGLQEDEKLLSLQFQI